MATDPWAAFNPQPAPQAQPVLTSPVDPYKAADEIRAQQDQDIQFRNLERAERSEARAERAEARADELADRQLEKDAAGSVEQGKAAGFMRRTINAERSIAKLDVSPRSLIGQTAADNFPNVTNYLSDANRQQLEQAEREFISGILRYDSGAAIPPEEFVSMGRTYFPRPGDTPENIRQKAEARRIAVEGLRDASGPVGQRAWDELGGWPEYSGDTDEPEGLTGTTTDDSPGLDIGSVSDDTPSPYDPGGGLNLNTIARGLSQGTDSIVRGVAALPGMIINPVGQALYDAAGYDQRYDVGNILSSALGLERNQSELGDAVIQGTASALTGGAAARAAGTIVNQAGTTGQVLNTLGRTPLRDAAAGAGAGAGMYAGNEVGGPVGGAIGALAGGAGGYATGNALASIASPVSRQLSQVGQAAQRQGVDLLPGDVGGPAVSSLSNAARQSYISASPMTRAAQSQSDQLRGAVGNVARRDGIIADSQEAGEGIRGAGERYISQTSRRGGVLYQRAQDAAGDTRISPPSTIAKVNSYIARMRENPMASQSTIQELERFRDGLEQGVTIGGLRDARTGLREGMFDGKLRSSSEQGMWKDILKDLSADIDTGLRQAGKTQAANQFKRADAFWTDRVEHIDDVLSPILGRDRGGEEIVAALEGMTRGSRGGNARLSRLLGNMEPQEAAQVRASVIDRLGRANPGAQNAEGDAFSAATFLTNWNKMTPQAKASLFGNSNQRRDLNEIAKLAEVVKQNASLANHSNTAGNLAANVGANVALFLTHPAAAVLGAVAQFGAGRLLSSPKFARWLASAPKNSSEAAARKWSENLGVVAANEPIIANDIASVQQFLADALARSPGRLAAQEDERN